MRTLRFSLALVVSLFAVALSGAAGAQVYPDRPVQLVAGYGAGSAIDSVARAVAQHMGTTLGHPVIVNNKPGAAGDIGTGFVAQAKADGYTILITSTSGFITQLAGASKYDVHKQLVPVAISGRAPWVLAVSGSSPFRSVKDVVDFARRNPGKIDYASIGGGMPQYLGELLASTENIEIVQVAYKTTADALPDVMAGRVAMLFTPMISAVSLHKSGKIRVLGVGGENRPEVLKDAPTMKEAGYPPLGAESTYYFFAPTGTPAAVVQKLNAAVNAALTDPAVRETLAAQGVLPQGGSIDETQQAVVREFAQWSKIVKPAPAK